MKKFSLLAFTFAIVFGGVFYWKNSTKTMSAEMNSESPVMRAPDNIGGVEDLNAIILSINTKNEVEPSLRRIVDFAKANPENQTAQLYATLALPIPMFKGIAWRARMLIEPIDAAYIASISWLRAIKRNNDRRAQHLDALFDYFTDPNPGENIKGQTGLFTSLGQFQDYMANQVAPVVEKQISIAQGILDNSNANQPLFMFDASLIFGAEVGPKMTSQTVRYRKFMPGHLQGMIANMHERLGFGYYLASYNMEGLARFMNTLTAQSLVSKKSDFAKGLIGNVFDIHLQSPKEVSQVLTRKEFASFLTLRPVAVQNGYLAKSLDHLRKANNARIKAFTEMERLARLPNQKEYFINADAVTSRPAMTLASLQKRQRLLNSNGPVEFSDRVTNSRFKMNVSALFSPNNRAIADLKKLYPRVADFKNVTDKTGNDPKTFRWNYDYGTAVNWPDVTFAGLLPETGNSLEYKDKLISISRDASTPAVTAWLRLFM